MQFIAAITKVGWCGDPCQMRDHGRSLGLLFFGTGEDERSCLRHDMGRVDKQGNYNLRHLFVCFENSLTDAV